MFAQTLTAVLIPASSVLLLASLAHAQPRERSGAEVVKAQCVKCHEAGLHGAPKIDDRAAWGYMLRELAAQSQDVPMSTRVMQMHPKTTPVVFNRMALVV